MNPPGSFTREERAAVQAGGWLPRTPSGRPAPSCLGAFAQAAAGPLPDSCCLPVICQVGRSACRRKGPPPISSGTGRTSWTPGLSLTPPCPRENASPTRDGSRTCPLVRHPGLSVSHVAGAQCPRNRRGALPDPVLCENRRGGPRGPQSRGGMGGGGRVRAHPRVQKAQACMLFPSCVTLGTGLHLSGPEPAHLWEGSPLPMPISELKHRITATVTGAPWGEWPSGGAPLGSRPATSRGGGPLFHPEEQDPTGPRSGASGCQQSTACASKGGAGPPEGREAARGGI